MMRVPLVIRKPTLVMRQMQVIVLYTYDARFFSLLN